MKQQEQCLKVMRYFIFGHTIVTDTLKLYILSNLTQQGEAPDAMISNQTPTSIEVVSFTSGPDLKYTVAIDPENNALLSCTCIDYFQNGHNCKHMYLVNMLESINLKQHSTVPHQSTITNQRQPNNVDVLFDEAVAR
jgi:hypothetical protein